MVQMQALHNFSMKKNGNANYAKHFHNFQDEMLNKHSSELIEMNISYHMKYTAINR